MAMASMADLNGAMGILKSDILGIQTTLAVLQSNFQAGGTHLQDELEKKKTELQIMNDLLKADLQTVVNDVSAEFSRHRAALDGLPKMGQELVGINGRYDQLIVKLDDLLLNINNRHMENEAAHKQIAGHVELNTAKLAALTASAGSAATTAATPSAPDPLQHTAWAAPAGGTSGASLPVPATPPGMPGGTRWPTDGAGGKGGRAGNP